MCGDSTAGWCLLSGWLCQWARGRVPTQWWQRAYADFQRRCRRWDGEQANGCSLYCGSWPSRDPRLSRLCSITTSWSSVSISFYLSVYPSTAVTSGITLHYSSQFMHARYPSAPLSLNQLIVLLLTACCCSGVVCWPVLFLCAQLCCGTQQEAAVVVLMASKVRSISTRTSGVICLLTRLPLPLLPLPPLPFEDWPLSLACFFYKDAGTSVLATSARRCCMNA